MTAKVKRPVSVYLSYAQRDKDLKEEFEDYLAIMQQTGLISEWVEREVQRGIDWSQIIDPRLLVADIVLMLISPAFLASGYCSGTEVREAFKRSETRKTRVIPIILHHVNLAGYPFENILSLPRILGSVASWPDRNKVWRDIDLEIRHVIEDMTKQY